MELRNRETGAVLTERAFRQELYNVSLPKVLTQSDVSALGYDTVLEGTYPTPSGPYDRVVRDGVKEIDSQWYTCYVIETETDPAAIQAIDDATAAQVRAQRDQLLRDTDYYVLVELEHARLEARAVDLTNPVNVYRQALRDIPQQAGFPHNVTFPTNNY